MREDQDRELMENQLRIVMIDRMLKEKYNEISYLAIQPPKDPQIVEIHRKDLDWLLEEQRKCEAAQKKLQEYERNYVQILDTKAWHLLLWISNIVNFFLKPVRALRKMFGRQIR